MTNKIELGKTIVRVTWQDAWMNSDYWTIEEVKNHQPLIIDSIGIIIQNDKQGVTIAREQARGDDRFRNVHHISRKMIRKVEILRP